MNSLLWINEYEYEWSVSSACVCKLIVKFIINSCLIYTAWFPVLNRVHWANKLHDVVYTSRSAVYVHLPQGQTMHGNVSARTTEMHVYRNNYAAELVVYVDFVIITCHVCCYLSDPSCTWSRLKWRRRWHPSRLSATRRAPIVWSAPTKSETKTKQRTYDVAKMQQQQQRAAVQRDRIRFDVPVVCFWAPCSLLWCWMEYCGLSSVSEEENISHLDICIFNSLVSMSSELPTASPMVRRTNQSKASLRNYTQSIDFSFLWAQQIGVSMYLCAVHRMPHVSHALAQCSAPVARWQIVCVASKTRKRKWNKRGQNLFTKKALSF